MLWQCLEVEALSARRRSVCRALCVSLSCVVHHYYLLYLRLSLFIFRLKLTIFQERSPLFRLVLVSNEVLVVPSPILHIRDVCVIRISSQIALCPLRE